VAKIKTSNVLYRLGTLLDVECIHLNLNFKTSLYSEGGRILLIHEIDTNSKFSSSEFITSLHSINDLFLFYLDTEAKLKHIILGLDDEDSQNEISENSVNFDIFFLSSEKDITDDLFIEADLEKVNSLTSELPLNSRFKLFDELIASFDREQQSLYLNDIEGKKIVISGSAGTGKTIIATSLARKHSAEGKRVLLLTYNIRLAQHIRDTLKNTDVDVSTAHQFFAYCLIDASKNLSPPEGLKNIDLYRAANFLEAHLKQGNSIDAGLTSEWYEEKLANYFSQSIHLAGDRNLYDTVIVDEAQLFPNWWLSNLNWSLKDKKNSTFAIFGDPLQDIYSQSEWPSWIDDHKELKKNYRNSKEIFKLLENLVDLSEFTSVGVSLKEVKYTKLNDTDDINLVCFQQLEESSTEVSSDQSISILTSDNITKKALINNQKFDKYIDNGLIIESFRRYTGLENDIIFLVIPTLSSLPSSINKSRYKNYLYTAASRAIKSLVIIAPENLIEELDKND